MSSDEDRIDGQIDQRFGRCNYFLIVEITNSKITSVAAVKNDAKNRSGSAGSFAAKQVAQLQAEHVITGDVGPNAADVLQQFGIHVHKGSGQIREALERFIKEGE